MSEPRFHRRIALVRPILLAALLAGCSGAAVVDAPKRPGDPDIAPPSHAPEPAKPESKPVESKPVESAPIKPADPSKAPEITPEVAKKPVVTPTAVGDISTFADGTPDGALRAALACSLGDLSDSAAFDCYARLNVLRNRDTDIAVAQLRAYSWKHFRQYAASYVVKDNPFTVRITRRDRETGGAEGKGIKLFLFSKSRDYPAPITLEREEGVWRIAYNSL